MSSQTVLSQQALEVLRSRGDNANLSGGYRCISTTSYLSEFSFHSQEIVLIPETIESVETLCFLELRPEVAEKVYDQFQERKRTFPDRATILKSAKDYISATPADAIYEMDDWAGAIDHLGLTANFKARLLVSDYTHMRSLGTLKHWVLEMMDMRWEFLQTLSIEVIETASGKKPRRQASSLNLSTNSFNGPAIPTRTSRYVLIIENSSDYQEPS